MMQQLRNMTVPKPTGEVAVADKEFNFESPVEEVDLQYEASRQQSEARFHQRMADTEEQGFLESHDGEWIVQRSTATTEEHADSHESHEKEGEPIGDLFLSCNITDHHPLEVVLTPRQKTEELELSIPLPHNWLIVLNSTPNSVTVDYLSEIFDTDSSRHGMDSIGGVVEQLSGVVEEESMMLRKDVIGNFEEFGNYSKFSLQFCLDAEAGGGKIDHGQGVELGDLISTLTQELGEGIQFVDDALRFLSDKITRAVVKVPAYLNDSQRISTEDVSSLSYGFERKTFTPKDVQVPEQDGKDDRDIFILEIGILVGKKHGGKREEDPLHGDMSFDRCLCIDEGLERVEKLETLFVKVDHLFRYNFQLKPLWILVRIRFWTKTGPWLESSLIHEAYGVCWQSLAKELETGESTMRLTHKCLLIIAFDVLMIVLRWIRERSVVRLLEASVRSNGQIRSASEAAGERERVLCLKRLLVVQGCNTWPACAYHGENRQIARVEKEDRRIDS
ncbi:hypothetical protein SASPL_126732 [Salvia splendens]|uniref:Uncharacterized protein n=1 Tax=Salvia splendens TaxID=180675 RepID=A0A8X8XME4_SALSN|nr:hypothetical protein SASPL_126732 [Salvia splendens]